MTLSHRPLAARMGLNLKILAALALILLGFAVTSGAAFSFIQRQELKKHLHQQGKMLVTMLSSSLQSGLFFADLSVMEEAVTTLLSLKTHEDLKAVAVYDIKDELLLRRLFFDNDSPSDPATLASPMTSALSAFRSNPDSNKIWENKELIIFTEPVTVAASQHDGESLFFETPDKTQARTVIGCTQLAMNKTAFDKAASSTVLQTAALTILFLIISLVATYMLTREAMMPLQRLVDTIRARQGLTGQEPDEVGLLDATFSQLIGELDRAFVTIQTLKDGLEETVNERTLQLSRALAELRETHMHLAQAEKMAAIGRLVAGVAHEINNTINFVSGALPPLRKRLHELEELLKGAERDRPDKKQCETIFSKVNILLENIGEGTRRTNKIVADLKSFSRPLDETPGPVDINQCLRVTCSLAQPEYKHRIRMEMDLAEDLPLVEGLSGQLNQVFMNLLLNAIQAQSEQGDILIRTWLAADQVHILIRDGGPGIPATIIDKIFEPFFTTKEPGKGTGLGLSISYGIIRKHQGQILVRSKPGNGTEFEITLPLQQRQP